MNQRSIKTGEFIVLRLCFKDFWFADFTILSGLRVVFNLDKMEVMTNYDDSSQDAYDDRKLAEQIAWQAKQAARKRYHRVAKELWDAYYALLEEAKMEEEKAESEE